MFKNINRMMVLRLKEIDIIITIKKELQLKIMKFFLETSIPRILKKNRKDL